MDTNTVIKAMLAVLNCTTIGQPAAIFAALEIAKKYQVQFMLERMQHAGEIEPIKKPE